MAIPSIPIVDTLPPAEASYRGHMFRVYLEGQDDQLVMCVKLADGTHNWVDVLVEPAFGTTAGTYAEGSHLHDDRYYTETEADALLAGKSATSHLHDDRYYTETESDGRYPSNATFTSHTGNTANPHSTTKAQVGLGSADNTSDSAKPISSATQTALNGKSATSHLHDDRYYTETEINSQMAGKANTGDIPTTEQIQDIVGEMLVSGSAMILDSMVVIVTPRYDDPAGKMYLDLEEG